MSGEWDGLRAAAEAAVTRSWTYIGSGTSSEEFGHKPGSSATYVDASGGATLTVEHMQFGRHAGEDATYIAAACPDVVLGLLDRLQAAEAAVERVRVVVAELRRPDLSLVGRIMSPSMRTIADALEGHESGVTGSLGPPQAEVALGASLGPEGAQGASGAESDHGGWGDGEGLG